MKLAIVLLSLASAAAAHETPALRGFEAQVEDAFLKWNCGGKAHKTFMCGPGNNEPPICCYYDSKYGPGKNCIWPQCPEITGGCGTDNTQIDCPDDMFESDDAKDEEYEVNASAEDEADEEEYEGEDQDSFEAEGGPAKKAAKAAEETAKAAKKAAKIACDLSQKTSWDCALAKQQCCVVLGLGVDDCVWRQCGRCGSGTDNASCDLVPTPPSVPATQSEDTDEEEE